MSENTHQASAEDRSHFFWWLGEWFLHPPAPEQLASLSADPQPLGPPSDTSDTLDAAWLALGALAPASDAATLERLGAEFTRLISGIQEGLGPPPPFESVWRENRLIGESTVAVIEAYARTGFADIDPEAGPQDHVGVELKFIALLALREAQAWQADDASTARQRASQQLDFLQAHLAAWAPTWANAIIEHAREPLFVALAGLLKAGLGQAAAELEEILHSTENATAGTHAIHRH
ncbi:MAG: molecular chaperone TorD family protein [Thiobacillaceae bacterium]